jgi:hypothetical protein
MATWPASVPTSCNITSLDEQDDDVLARFKPEVGVEKLRQRTNLVIQPITYEKVLTTTQWDALLSFYRVDCKNGALAFTGTHPRKGTTIVAQWTQKPTMRTLDSHTLVNVSISYTVLPINAP